VAPRSSRLRLSVALFLCAGSPLGAVGTVSAAASGAPGLRAHALFDDTTGPWLTGITPGSKAQPLRHARAGVRDPQTGSGPGSVTVSSSASGTPPDPEVLGFAQAGEVTSGAWQSDLTMRLLTTIAYFGVNLNGDGTLVTSDSGYQGWWSSQATSLINAAHSAGDRVVLTVKAFSNTVIAAVTGSAQSRASAVSSIVSQVSARGADGVNLDFEGTDSSVAGHFDTFVSALSATLRSQLPQQAYLTVDTYASAASGGTMYDIRGLGQSVDAFDVMAYDITSPGAAFAGPVAPLNGMTYADTNTVNSYLQLIAPSQLILGVPYYGYKWSTTTNQPQAQTIGTASADTYSGAISDFQCAQQLSQHWDPTFAAPWASWFSPSSGYPCGGNHGSWRELYYENGTSLGAKYDLVNNKHLRGIGIWALGYDTGHQELWNEIATKFTVTHAPTPLMTALPTSEASRTFQLGWSVPNGSPTVSAYVVYAQDGSSGWQPWTRTAGNSATFFGFPGHTYSFYVEAFVAGGYGSGAPGGTAMTATTVSASAAQTEPFTALYAVDGQGALLPGSSPPLPPGEMFPGWDITRGLTVEPTGQGGLMLDGWGGLHPFGDSPGAMAQSYWPGWDIARAVATFPSGGGGYVLDGWGGVHPFAVGSSAMPSQPRGGSYWPGWDIARAMTLFADGSGGLVLDGLGGLHPFTGAGVVASPVVSAYWSNWDIARGVALLPNSSGSSYAGYVLDGWGGLHPFASRGRAMPAAPGVSAYWPGYDIARGLTMIPGTAMGYVLDGIGGFWPFGGAPAVQSPDYGTAGATVRSPAAA
jgi:spore germination protein YaaH